MYVYHELAQSHMAGQTKSHSWTDRLVCQQVPQGATSALKPKQTNVNDAVSFLARLAAAGAYIMLVTGQCQSTR
jgi:hypothetical protein